VTEEALSASSGSSSASSASSGSSAIAAGPSTASSQFPSSHAPEVFVSYKAVTDIKYSLSE